MDLLPAMFVISCNRLQQYTELKLLVVMRQVLHCIHIPAAPTRYFINEISRVTTTKIDLSRLLSSSSQLVKRPGETLIARTLAAYSLVVRQTRRDYAKTLQRLPATYHEAYISPSRRRSQALSAAVSL